MLPGKLPPCLTGGTDSWPFPLHVTQTLSTLQPCRLISSLTQLSLTNRVIWEKKEREFLRHLVVVWIVHLEETPLPYVSIPSCSLLHYVSQCVRIEEAHEEPYELKYTSWKSKGRGSTDRFIHDEKCLVLHLGKIVLSSLMRKNFRRGLFGQ